MFLQLIINQNEKSPTRYLWDIYQEKPATKFSKVSWWVLLFEDPRNFQNSFFVKNHYLNLLFFQVLQSALLTQRKKNLLKEDTSYLKIGWHSKRQRKTIEKRDRKTKNEKKPNRNNKYFFTLALIFKKIHILLENKF